MLEKICTVSVVELNTPPILLNLKEIEMRPLTVRTDASAGYTLCSNINSADGRRVLGKGHEISLEDATLLQEEGLDEVQVVGLEEGEVSEKVAAEQVAQQTGCGSLVLQPAPGGRANLFAKVTACVLVDEILLTQANSLGGITIATAMNLSYVKEGVRVATVKTFPFAVTKTQLEAVLLILKERGPILQARPIPEPNVAVLYTDPLYGGRAQQLFGRIMHGRLQRFGTEARFVDAAVEEKGPVARSLRNLLRSEPTCVIIASTTSPAGPDDVVGQAMVAVGCEIRHFLVPVEPGNLLLLGYYQDRIPVVSTPGCFRSLHSSVLDLVLPPMLAGYRMTSPDFAALGHGGLLKP